MAIEILWYSQYLNYVAICLNMYVCVCGFSYIDCYLMMLINLSNIKKKTNIHLYTHIQMFIL